MSAGSSVHVLLHWNTKTNTETDTNATMLIFIRKFSFPDKGMSEWISAYASRSTQLVMG